MVQYYETLSTTHPVAVRWFMWKINRKKIRNAMRLNAEAENKDYHASRVGK